MRNNEEKKLSVVVVDDELLALKNVRALLKKMPDIELISEYQNGREAVKAIRSLEPDIVFLDIQMPGMDGFEVLENLASHKLPAIIFMTAYDQYAVKAFDVHAVDYLLKPFNDARFKEALTKARRLIEREEMGELGQKLLTLLESHQMSNTVSPKTKWYLGRILIKSADRIVFLNVNDVDWIEACDYYVKLHAGGKAHLLRKSMSDLELILDPQIFARIHRSSMVNLNRVREIRQEINKEYAVILYDGTHLKLSRRRREELRKALRIWGS